MNESVSADLFSHFNDLCDDLICIVEQSGSVIYINSLWVNLLGYAEEEILSKSFLDIVHPDDRSYSQKQIEQLFNGSDTVGFENRFVCKDGSIKHFHWKVKANISQKTWNGIGRDNSNQKKTQDQYQLSEELFRRAIADSPVPIMIHDEDDRILQLSKGWTDYSGYELADIPTMSDWTLKAYGSSTGTEKAYIDKLFEIDQTEDNGEWTINAKDGSKRIWDFKTTPVGKNKNGKRLLHSLAVDITDRKAAEEKLRRTDLIVHETNKIAKIGGWELNLSTMEPFFSEETFKIYEIPPPNPPSVEDGIKYYAPEGRPLIEKAVQDAIESNIPYDIELPFITGTGKRIWVRAQGKTYFENGKAVRLYGTIQDITDRIEADAKLRESEELYRNIYNSTPVMLHSIDTQGRLLSVSDYWLSTLGYKRNEVLGKKSVDFITLKSREYAENVVLPEFFKKGYVNNVPYQFVKKDGQVIDTLLSAIAEYDGAGEVKQSLAVIVDVTDAKQAQKDLTKSEAKFRDLANTAKVAISIVTTAIENGILYVNNYWQELTGYSKEDSKQMSALEIIHPQEKEMVGRRAVQRLAGESAPDRYELRIRTKSGETKWVELSAIVVEFEGISASLTTAIDITEKKKMILELEKAKEKAEESDQLKSAFLANMSHEIRTPMNGILGFTELLKEPEITNDEQNKYIEVIESSGLRLLNIINDLVDLSKIDSGLSEVSISEIDINEQIEFLKTFFNPEANKKGIELSIKSKLDPKDTIVRTDREKLFAILTNLLKNAIKFTQKGFIEIACRRIDQRLQFSVKDTGIGISKEQQGYIFKRFRQGDISHTKDFEGSGLGLSISKGYIDLLNGEIWVESEEGKGSTFYFTIPI